MLVITFACEDAATYSLVCLNKQCPHRMGNSPFSFFRMHMTAKAYCSTCRHGSGIGMSKEQNP